MRLGEESWLLVFPLLVLTVSCASGSGDPMHEDAEGRWSVARAQDWQEHQPWVCGFNYVPSTACNTTEFWLADTFDAATIERELGWAQQTGFNSCRVFLQYLVWRHDPNGFKNRLERFLEIAAHKGISVVPVLFDDCTFGKPRLTEPWIGRQRDPIPGMILPSWTPSPGLSRVTNRNAWPDLERYVGDVVSTFKDDTRIVFWDLYNEPGNSDMGEKSTPLMAAAFTWAREAGPSQPLSVGIWSGMEPMNTRIAALSDIITYHAYAGAAGQEQAIVAHRAQGRPIVCTEWMARLRGSRWETDLPIFARENVSCFCWGLVNGRTQAQFSWDSQPGAPEPEIWFHDLFHADGTPYDPAEIAVIQRICRQMGTQARHAARGIPTPEQLAWHEMEIQMFLCLDPCTWQGREYDDHSTPLDQINPAALDTEQWCAAAESFGAKQILFVAKHVGGFCWWPTETTEYSVRNIPWEDGQGDVLAELSASCRRHGLRLGIYIYPGDDQWGAGIGSGGRTADPAKQDAYNQVLRRQWTEVLTRYGEISELWFDGSCVVDLGDIIFQYAPRAMVFQGPLATLRWPGNEQGIAPDPAWQTVRRADALSGVATGAHSDPDGDVWLPMEMDTPLLDHKWFWAPETDGMIKSLETLMDIYCASVGRGCVLLLNATPDTTGRIPESHMRRYREFGEAIRGVYANKKGEISGAGTEFEVRFAAPTAVTHVVIMEDIRQGHAVREFLVEGKTGGAWRKLTQAESLGYKRIERFERTEFEALRLRIVKSAQPPVILQFAAFDAADGAPPPGQTEEPAWESVEAWAAIAPKSEWQTAEVDLTPYIEKPGEYIVEIITRDGDAELETDLVTLLVAGAEAPRLVTPLERPNAWRVLRTDQVVAGEKGRTMLRLAVRIVCGGTWCGEMHIRRGP